MPVVAHLATRGGEAVAQILLEVIDDKGIHEYPIRMAAVRALLDMNCKSIPSLSTSAAELLEEGESAQWPRQVIEEVKRLNAKAALQ